MLNRWLRYLLHQAGLWNYIALRLGTLLWRMRIALAIFVGILMFTGIADLRLLIRSASVNPHSKAYCNAPAPVSGNERKLHFIEERLKNFRLQQVQIIIRHGDRAPVIVDALPNVDPVKISCLFQSDDEDFQRRLDVYKNVAFSNRIVVDGTMKKELVVEQEVCDPGLLSPCGILQHSFIGEHLRDSYKEFLVTIDPERDVYVQATNYHRTIQSAASLLVGTFPNLASPGHASFEPIRIHVFPDLYDETHFLFDEAFQSLQCPVLKGLLANISSGEAAVSFRKSVEPLYVRLADELRASVSALPALNYIVDVIYTRLCHGQGLPVGPDGPIPSRIVDEALRFANEFTAVKHGPVAEHQTLSLLSQIAMRAFTRLVQESSDAGRLKSVASPKLVLYSGHDSILVPFLINLNAYSNIWPPYASRIVVELYTKEDGAASLTPSASSVLINSYIRLLYNGDVITGSVKFCRNVLIHGQLCPVLDLFSYVSDDRFSLETLYYDMSKGDVYGVLFSRIKSICAHRV